MANLDCCGCRNELESRDSYPCNWCLRNEVLFADNYEAESPQREEGQGGTVDEFRDQFGKNYL